MYADLSSERRFVLWDPRGLALRFTRHKHTHASLGLLAPRRLRGNRPIMVASAFMGTWDKIYPACPKISDRYKFFASGWGDKQRGDKAMSDFRDWVLLGKYHNSELRNSIKLVSYLEPSIFHRRC